MGILIDGVDCEVNCPALKMENGLGSVFAKNFNKTTSSDYPQAFRITVLCAAVLDIEEGALPFPIYLCTK